MSRAHLDLEIPRGYQSTVDACRSALTGERSVENLKRGGWLAKHYLEDELPADQGLRIKVTLLAKIVKVPKGRSEIVSSLIRFLAMLLPLGLDGLLFDRPHLDIHLLVRPIGREQTSVKISSRTFLSFGPIQRRRATDALLGVRQEIDRALSEGS